MNSIAFLYIIHNQFIFMFFVVTKVLFPDEITCFPLNMEIYDENSKIEKFAKNAKTLILMDENVFCQEILMDENVFCQENV